MVFNSDSNSEDERYRDNGEGDLLLEDALLIELEPSRKQVVERGGDQSEIEAARHFVTLYTR